MKQIDEFRQVLENYEISEHGKSVLKRANLLLFNGPTAGGRNTIINELHKTDKYVHIVSDTTRPKRQNDGVWEENGVQYWFRDEADVLADLRAGEFIEAAIIHNQQVSGTTIREVEDALKHDKVSVLEIQYDGVVNIINEKPDAHVVWVTPPSFEEWLNRLHARGSLTEEEFQNRFASAEIEYEHALENDFYKYVTNDFYHLAAKRIRQIVETGDYSEEENQKTRDICIEILGRIRQELGK